MNNINPEGGMVPGGGLRGQRIRNLGHLEDRTYQRPPMWWRLRQAWLAKRDIPMRVAQMLLGQVHCIVQFQSNLVGQVYKVDWSKLAPWQAEQLRELLRTHVLDVNQLPSLFRGEVINYGVLSRKTITDTGVAWIVDCWQNTYELEIMKYHALGTGGTAENQNLTTLTTEITANHYTSSNRPFDSAADGASANIIKLIGTHTQATAGDTITEHAIVSTITSTYVMWDRHLFSGVPLAVSDSFVTTYNCTLTAGG